MATAKKVRTLLIDADILMFRFAFRHQSEIEWSNGFTSEVLRPEEAIADLDNFIHELLVNTNCVDYILCFTHAVNFRYAVLPTYKANRSKQEPPVMLTLLKEHMLENHPNMAREYLEADDLIGITATANPDDYVAATIDKDFLSLPIRLYNWSKPKLGVRVITERQADYSFHKQWLTGDQVDGYGGVWKIGEKKAEKILHKKKHSEFSAAVVQTYADKCYSWEEMCVQAQMARILRIEDYDLSTSKPILWQPDC